jgi:hypothetical protein
MYLPLYLTDSTVCIFTRVWGLPRPLSAGCKMHISAFNWNDCSFVWFTLTFDISLALRVKCDKQWHAGPHREWRGNSCRGFKEIVCLTHYTFHEFLVTYHASNKMKQFIRIGGTYLLLQLTKAYKRMANCVPYSPPEVCMERHSEPLIIRKGRWVCVLQCGVCKIFRDPVDLSSRKINYGIFMYEMLHEWFESSHKWYMIVMNTVNSV